MAIEFALNKPLMSVLWTDKRKGLRNISLVLAGVVMLALSARLTILLQPVPVTMQTFVVMLIGMTYGWRLGLATVVSYLALGALGLPVFAIALLGPTSGYLAGFIAAVLICGYLLQAGWGRSFFTVLLAGILATMSIYALGVTVLAAYVGWAHALQFGLLPFLLVDSAKVLVLALIVPKCWHE